MWSVQERHKTRLSSLSTCRKGSLLTLWCFHSVGGVFKVTPQSLVILSLLTILMPYLYGVSADEKQQIRRQGPGRERHTDNRSQCWQSELHWGSGNRTALMAPDSNYQSKRKPCIHDGLHNLQSPVQNGNAKSLVKKLWRIFRPWQQSIKTSVWPFWEGAPHDCIHCKSMKPDLLVPLYSVYYAWKWKGTSHTLCLFWHLKS